MNDYQQSWYVVVLNYRCDCVRDIRARHQGFDEQALTE